MNQTGKMREKKHSNTFLDIDIYNWIDGAAINLEKRYRRKFMHLLSLK
jgi:hypothetical protein